MTQLAYYKTNEPSVLEARALFDAEKKAVGQKIDEFAKRFGGIAYTRFSLHSGYSFAGLRFEPHKVDPLWTKPDNKDNGIQRPRVSIQGATREQKSELAALKTQWKPPQDRALVEPFLKSMGTSSGGLIFTGPVSMFQHDGHVWVMAGVKLAPFMTEVLASEFRAAEAALHEERAANQHQVAPQ